MGFGWTEILLIAVVVLLVFGPERLPDLARGIGESMSEIKKGMRDIQSEVEEPVNTLEEEAAGWSRATDPGALEQKEPDSNAE